MKVRSHQESAAREESLLNGLTTSSSSRTRAATALSNISKGERGCRLLHIMNSSLLPKKDPWCKTFFPPVINLYFRHQWVRLLLPIHSNNLTFLCRGKSWARPSWIGGQTKQTESPVQGDASKTLCLFSYPHSRKGTCPQPHSHN